MLCKNKEIADTLGIDRTSVSRTYMGKSNKKVDAVDMGVYCIKNGLTKEDVKMIVDSFVATKEYIRAKI